MDQDTALVGRFEKMTYRIDVVTSREPRQRVPLVFPRIEVNGGANKTFYILNEGNTPLDVENIIFPDGFSGNGAGGEVLPGGFQQVNVTFSPSEVGDYEGLIEVASNATEGENTVEVRGSAWSGTYTVRFDLGGKGERSGGGELLQEVDEKQVAVAPLVAASPGFHFSGWDRSFDEVTEELTVGALYSAASLADVQASDGTEDGYFGWSIAGDRGALLVGALGAGTAYIFEQSSTGAWMESAILPPKGPVPGLGYRVALHKDVAAASLGDLAEDIATGTVLVFERDGEIWSQVAELNGDIDEGFGSALAIEGDKLAVGALTGGGDRSGVVHIYERNESGWSKSTTLHPDIDEHGESFGFGLNLHGDRLAVGAPTADGAAINSGAVYLFQRGPSGDWERVDRLTANDGAAFDRLGESVSLKGGILLAGSHVSDGSGENSGAAYVFEQSEDGDWFEAAKLLPGDGGEFDFFGKSVALSWDVAFVGAPGFDTASAGTGAAYIFARDAEGQWEQTQRVLAPSAGAGEYLGEAVTLAGGVAVAAALGRDAAAENSGEVFLFDTGFEDAAIEFTGLDQVYDGTAQGVQVLADPSGLEHTVSYDGSSSPPTDAGSYSVVARITEPGYLPVEAGATLIIGRASQSIGFELPERVYEDAGTVPLLASATSGLPVSFTSSQPGVASVEGQVLRVNGLGNATITATQPGNGNWLAAEPVLRPLKVASAPTYIMDVVTSFNPRQRLPLVFPPLGVNYSTQRTFYILNDGNQPLEVDSITYPEGFTGSWNGGSVPPGSLQSIHVTFKPFEVGDFEGIIEIISNATQGVNAVEVRGVGIPRGLFEFTKWAESEGLEPDPYKNIPNIPVSQLLAYIMGWDMSDTSTWLQPKLSYDEGFWFEVPRRKALEGFEWRFQISTDHETWENFTPGSPEVIEINESQETVKVSVPEGDAGHRLYRALIMPIEE